jgi:archaemetzincin
MKRKTAMIACWVAAFCILFAISSCSTNVEPSENSNSAPDDRSVANIATLRREMVAVVPFFHKLPAPGPTDWLANFKEPGQTFDEYLNANPTVPTADRRTLYVLPLGSFSDEQNTAIKLTAGYLEAFYGLPVKFLTVQAIKRPLRTKDQRTNAISKKVQVRTGYILDDVLRPMLPPDAAALIAFTNEDLFPDSSMSFVFGQASLEDRVAVWSLFRLKSNADRKTFLLRTIKIATHETGHMFSMHHCTAYSCVMSGTNHLAETDSHPIDACPECMAKICWFSDIKPAERYWRLADFCTRNSLTKEAAEFEKKYQAVKAIDPDQTSHRAGI